MKNIYAYTMSFGLAMLLPACTVGPDFVRPDPPTTTSYTTEKNLDTFGSQKINQSKRIPEKWWHEFASPELNAVVERGIKNSHYLAAMHKTLEQAEEILKTQQAQLWPMISLEVDAGRTQYGAAFLGQDSDLIPPFTYYTIGPSLTYLLDIFGITRRAIENAKALAEYQAYAYHGAYLTLTGQIVTTCIVIGMLNDQIDIAHKIIENDKKNLQLQETAFKLGSSNKNDVISARNQLLQSQALLPQFNGELTRAKNQLNRLVGSDPTQWQPPHFRMSQFKLPKDLPLSLPSELVHNRPDILAAEATLHAANATVGVATASLYPNIVITGAFMQEAISPSQLFTAQSSAWSYLGSLTAPVFNAGMLQAAKRAAVRVYEASYSNYQEVVVKSFTQVNEVLHALQIDANAEQLSKKSLSNTRESLDLVKKNQSVGGVGLLDVLTAQRHYLQSQLAYGRVEGQRYQDTVQLYLVLGGNVIK